MYLVKLIAAYVKIDEEIHTVSQSKSADNINNMNAISWSGNVKTYLNSNQDDAIKGVCLEFLEYTQLVEKGFDLNSIQLSLSVIEVNDGEAFWLSTLNRQNYNKHFHISQYVKTK